MERRVWRVELEGKQLVVEYKVKMAGEGEVLVDGKVVDSWGSSVWVWGLPKERSFTIEGKPATLRRRGTVSQHFDLVFEGRVYTEKEGRV